MSPEAAPAGLSEPWVVGTLERHQLDATSWIDLGRGWLRDSEQVYDALTDGRPDGVSWQANTIWRYDHAAAEPRLSATCRPGPRAPHPAVTELHRRLRAHYAVPLDGVGMSWYRTGRDAMGAHRDSDLRHCDDTVIAVVTLGARRPWTLTPVGNRTPAFDVDPGPGDVLVMGGRAQRDWLHGVPPAPAVRTGRVSLQWRWTAGTGRPERGGSSGAPRQYGGGR